VRRVLALSVLLAAQKKPSTCARMGLFDGEHRHHTAFPVICSEAVVAPFLSIKVGNASGP